jgi:hypothetical protein
MIDIEKIKPMPNDVLLLLKPKSQVEGARLIQFKEDSDSETQYFKVLAIGEGVKHVTTGDYVCMSWKRITVPRVGLYQGRQREYGITAEKEIDAVIENHDFV